MHGGIGKLFDLSRDIKLDGVEMALAYSVIFESNKEHESDYDSNSSDKGLWEE